MAYRVNTFKKTSYTKYTKIMKKNILIGLLFFGINCIAQVNITINPHSNSAIKGNLELNRLKYFNLSGNGFNFERMVRSQSHETSILDDNNVTFGRGLGLIKGRVRSENSIFEDPDRPGYLDIDRYRSRARVVGSESDAFKNRWTNTDVAYHEAHKAYPAFLEKWKTSPGDEEFPVNTKAAAEIVTSVLKHGFNDFNRPGTYEIINEPHWAAWGDQRFADLHLDVLDRAKSEGISTEIGGPCYSVGFFYKRDYQNLQTFTKFIRNTQARLDFYSFHVYDFMKWDAQERDFRGRVTTGLPLEGVLDAIQNYTVNNFSKEIPIVLSEHGGYLSSDTNNIITDELAQELIGGGTGFDYEMKKRSIGCRVMTRSAISNTMTFMNNPHVIRKGVPFILTYTGWNTRYYAALLVARDFNGRNSQVMSPLINFYKFFADVKGRRVTSSCEDPDVQYHTFVSGKELYIVLNNLSGKSEDINFNISDTDYERIEIKRHGENADFTPYFTEEELSNLDNFSLRRKEAVVLKITYRNTIDVRRNLNIVPHYGDVFQKKITRGQEESFKIKVPNYRKVTSAILRIGVGRGINTDRDIRVKLNGRILTVPMEDAAEYLENGSEYGSTKIIKVNSSDLVENNIIKISFNDNKEGGIGAVVLRTAIEENSDSSDSVNFKNLPTGFNQTARIPIDLEYALLEDKEMVVILTSPAGQWLGNGKKTVRAGSGVERITINLAQVPNPGQNYKVSVVLRPIGTTNNENVVFDEKLIEIIGLDSTSNILPTIKDTESEGAIRIFPNPVIDKLEINKEATWELYSQLGQLLIRGFGKEVDMSNFEEGIYFLKTELNFHKILKQ